jgi:hypoxanthine phosphoribosyltransferase
VNSDSVFLQRAQGQHRQVLHITWEEIHALTSQVARRIQGEGTPDVLVGLQRGGLIPAIMLSHQLAVPNLLVLPIRRTLSDAMYAAKMAPRIVLTDSLCQIAKKDVLVIDDIAGSGDTLRIALKTLADHAPARLRSATCIVNRAHWDPVNAREPGAHITYIGREVRAWVVFPWETSFAGGDENEGKADG